MSSFGSWLSTILGLGSVESPSEEWNADDPAATYLVGLKNIGNSCFFNVVIQSLISNPPFIQMVTRLSKEEVAILEEQREAAKSHLSAKPSGFLRHRRDEPKVECYSFSALLHELLQLSQRKPLAARRSASAVVNGSLNPHALFDYVCSVSPGLVHGEQCDAHEAFNKILEMIDAELHFCFAHAHSKRSWIRLTQHCENALSPLKASIASDFAESNVIPKKETTSSSSMDSRVSDMKSTETSECGEDALGELADSRSTISTLPLAESSSSVSSSLKSHLVAFPFGIGQVPFQMDTLEHASKWLKPKQRRQCSFLHLTLLPNAQIHSEGESRGKRVFSKSKTMESVSGKSLAVPMSAATVFPHVFGDYTAGCRRQLYCSPFNFEALTSVKCGACIRCSVGSGLKRVKMNHISVQMPSASYQLNEMRRRSLSLHELVQQCFVRNERIDGYKCARCKRSRVFAVRSKQLLSAPRILMIYVNRVDYATMQKNNLHVAFEVAFYLPLAGRRVVHYRLNAAVVHYGGVHSGHYTVYRRTLDADTGDTLWVHLSDDTAARVPLSEVLNCKVYMLFYERV